VTGITFERGRNAGSAGLSKVGGGGVQVFRSNPVIEDCVFRACVAPSGGDGAPAVYLVQGVDAVIRGCLFVDNSGGDIGGAVGILQHTNALVEGNTFVRNVAGDRGGAIEINISTATLDGNIFALNSAVVGSGAILCLNGTVVSGSCNLFWDNAAPIDTHMTASCSFVGTDDNVVAHPRFCAPAHGNFFLDSQSPGLPGNNACRVQIGAFPVGCGPVSLDPSTWGRIKASYR